MDGFVIEDGAIPHALAPFMQIMLELLPGSEKPKGISRISKLSKILASMSSRFSGPYTPNGSLERTQTYLIMSHDENQATLTLNNNKPTLKFAGVGRMPHVHKLNQKLRDATTAFDGTFVQQPFFSLNSQQEITVHPIGGISMSRDGTGANGATNHRGELFTGEDEDTYEGLAIVDASVIPTPLGANPFATITALAERSVELMAQKYDIKIDYETKNSKFLITALKRRRGDVNDLNNRTTQFLGTTRAPKIPQGTVKQHRRRICQHVSSIKYRRLRVH